MQERGKKGSSSGMSSSRRKAEEKTLRLLRELAAEAGNKTCFDCHQRGPTYINMTIGAFVCTGCSGILRGLNPPHRVKSISMATFSAEEVEFLRQRGNVYCRRVWLGLYDGSRQDGARDEQQMKDFLALKYEKRRWYVDPSEVARQDSLREAHPASQPAAPAASSPLASPGLHHSEPPPREAARPHPHPSHPPAKAPSLDLFAADPFASPVHAKPLPGAQPTPFAQAAVSAVYQPPPPANVSNGSGFADFETNFDSLSFNSAPAPAPAPVNPPMPAVSKPPPGFGSPLAPLGSGTSAPPMHKSATMPGVSASAGPHMQSAGDKYSALKELDSLFSTEPVTGNGGGGTSSEATSGLSSFTSSWSSTATPAKPAFPTPSAFPSTGAPDPFGAPAMPKSVSAMGAFGLSSPPPAAPPANPFAGTGPVPPAANNPFLGSLPPFQAQPTPFAAAPPPAWPQSQPMPQQNLNSSFNNSSGGGQNWNPFL